MEQFFSATLTMLLVVVVFYVVAVVALSLFK